MASFDRKIKAILDEFLPYEESEYSSPEKWRLKTDRRTQLADAIIAYKNDEIICLPGLNIDMKEVIKKMKSEN